MIIKYENVPHSVIRIANFCKEAGGKMMVVGGWVRDQLLGIDCKDCDVEVYGIQPDDLMQLIRSHGFEFQEAGLSFGVLKIKGEDIDVSIPRRENKAGLGHRGFEILSDPTMTVADAARRRDFTINSMAYDPLEDQLIDPFGGVSDLENHILRHTSDAFTEDPLRVLRGMQFIARFNLTPDPMTVILCRTLNMDELSRERVYDEWVKLITKGVKISKGLNFLLDTTWIKYFPELYALVGLPQDPEWHPEGDVFTHTSLSMDAFAEIRDMKEQWDQIVTGFAVLCHDFGKVTTTEQTNGRITSKRHESEGEGPTRSFLGRMIESNNQKKPSELIEQVVALVINHMAPTNFYKQGADNSAVRRLAERVGRIDLLLNVSRCDKMGRGSLKYEPWAEVWLEKKADDVQVLDSKPKPIILGRHLIDRGMTPGPCFKEFLEAAYEDQMDGKFIDEESAMKYLDALIPE